MILSLSQAWHPFLPPAAALHSRAHRLVTLFSLVCKVCRAVALQGEEGHPGALIGDQTESVGIASNHPWEVGKLWVLPLPLVIPNPEERGPTLLVWGSSPGGHVISTLPHVRIPKSCLSKLPAPHPHGFKVQSSEAQGWGLLGPHPTLPKKGELCPRRGNSSSSRAVGPGEEVQVSTGGLVLPTHPMLQVWLGTSCAVHWPGFSSGVLPE